MAGNTYGFGYNGRNRMTVVQLNGTTVGSYTYNALGQRIAKTATLPQPISQRFAYDEAGQLIGEYGTVNRDYIWMDALPVAVVDTAGTSSTLSYVHADGLGTPRAITNASGVTQWQWPYQSNPFGEQQPVSSAGYVFNLRFPGQYFDVESNTHYNYFRQFDPSIGRYLQSDPIGLNGGMSSYGYGYGSPLMFIDPYGQDGICRAVFTIAGSVCGGFVGQQVGGIIVGAGGAVVGSSVGPEGTIGGGAVGYGAGSMVGGAFGAATGGLAGNAIANKMCATASESREQACEKRLEREETMCGLMAGPRYPGNSKQAVKICMTAAFKRYTMCLKGIPESEWPPLTGVETEI